MAVRAGLRRRNIRKDQCTHTSGSRVHTNTAGTALLVASFAVRTITHESNLVFTLKFAVIALIVTLIHHGPPSTRLPVYGRTRVPTKCVNPPRARPSPPHACQDFISPPPAIGLRAPRAASPSNCPTIRQADPLANAMTGSFELGIYHIVDLDGNTALRNYSPNTPAYVKRSTESPGRFCEWKVEQAENDTFKLFNEGPRRTGSSCLRRR
ncbi:hypothetical protein B0H19DRAFT_1069494 [Mycena capillaripes]|nr:hypothetical protein B0H19DRAFT_1069494 [Mycena capillaripes]